jgi:hypothetical protein
MISSLIECLEYALGVLSPILPNVNDLPVVSKTAALIVSQRKVAVLLTV